jgi:hypothetical protein
MATERRSIMSRADEVAKALADVAIGTMIVLIHSARADRERRTHKKSDPATTRSD